MAGDWTPVGPTAALDEARALAAEIDGTPITIVRAAGRLYAFEDRCSHDGEPLAGAEIEVAGASEPPVVICPRHGARFCLAHGSALTPPAYEPIRVFAARDNAGTIEVQVA